MGTTITAGASDGAGGRGVARVARGTVAGMLCLTLAWLWLASAPASGAARYACGRYGGRTIARSARVRVFIRQSTYYSCWLPTRKRTRLGVEGEGEPEGPAVVSTPVHINGQYVAWATEGVAEGGEEAIMFALNARTGRILHEVEAPQRFEDDLVSSVTEVGVAADGSLVYLQDEGSPCPGNHMPGNKEHNRDEALIAYEPGNHHRLLECEIASEPELSIAHLRVVGQRASWTNAGAAHTVTLR
jgi:hypothetical protein